MAPATVALTSGSGFHGAPSGSVNDLANWKKGSITEGAVNFVEGVWVDPTTHDLDFFYQIQNNSIPATGQTGNASTVGNQGASPNLSQTTVILTGYMSGFTENVFEITSAQFNASALGGSLFVKPSTGESIASVSNTVPGVLTVNFNQAITPGKDSAILVVKTDAKNFDNGGQAFFHWKQNPDLHGGTSGTAFNSENISLGTLEPTPEPGAYGLLSLAVAGLFLVVRKRSEKTRACNASV